MRLFIKHFLLFYFCKYFYLLIRLYKVYSTQNKIVRLISFYHFLFYFNSLTQNQVRQLVYSSKMNIWVLSLVLVATSSNKTQLNENHVEQAQNDQNDT